MAVDDAERAGALRRARRRATGLLVVVAAGFLATFALPETTATGYVRAALEAGLVGGLADWFAVVALFRHPLGIPIPHTAVIPRSKEGLGANIATFVRGNFLGADQLRDRLVHDDHPRRLAGWLADADNADRVAVWIAGAAASAAGSMDEDAVVGRGVDLVRRRLADLPSAELAGEALARAVAEKRHERAVTAAVDGLLEVLERDRAELRRRLGEQSPSWVPAAVDDLVFDRAERVVRGLLRQVADEPDHELRRALDEQLVVLAGRLRSDPGLQARAAEVLTGLAGDELVDATVRGWWRQLRQRLEEAAEPRLPHAAALRRPVVAALTGFARRLQDDPVLQRRLLDSLEAMAPRAAAYAERQAGELISTTIDRWDAADTAHRLELWLGRDLQFVRVNGTVVGAAVGVVLHLATRLLA